MSRVIWKPQKKQAQFMARPEFEALYGGAAGGGKSDALVIEALRQVHIPHYKALILRKTYPQLGELIVRREPNMQRDAALFREFDSVSDEVEENLADALGVDVTEILEEE